LSVSALTAEQNKNILQTDREMEGNMLDLVQDVAALLSLSTFVVSVAMWIGAL
jgi:hypothetical protein